MRNNRSLTILLVTIACLGLCSIAAAQANQRPIQDFLNAQTTFGFYWTDPATGQNLLVDYSGKYNAYIVAHGGPDAGTTFDGKVTERPLKDGRTQVDVSLHTHNAYSYAFSSVPLFGYTTAEVISGKPEALGDSLLTISFISDQPVNGALPDLDQLYYFTRPGQVPGKLSFVADATGALRLDFGVPEGTPGRARTTQQGLYGVPGKGLPPDHFPVENVKIWQVGQ